MTEEHKEEIGMPFYIGVKLVKARPQPCPHDVHTNKKGDPGYLVRYEDGYESWCPAAVFEEANRLVEAMSFGFALEAMVKGMVVMRKGWEKRALFTMVRDTDDMGQGPYFYTFNRNIEGGKRVPWLPLQSDMLADDWQIIGQLENG